MPSYLWRVATPQLLLWSSRHVDYVDWTYARDCLSCEPSTISSFTLLAIGGSSNRESGLRTWLISISNS
jgi:hypothetical protein